ncbi:helicase, putative [Candidatus Pelagibacter sp. HTCC7211]|uniref:helicase-related protein n=1 Tax=Pelagibacter sp. (strain HTCC7211) TaxID=439493 RepID=UPI000183896D|nr:helicase-related protein [Candidatus Pelagibacter sp. HTCC7211]EDZ60764.1 helicase, putative [Candidatus Pelagibacter sp. HTCC7211]MBD1151603.1 helicase [Pelagibacterales bacterium SAG-MED25]
MTKHKITAILGPTNTGKTHLAIETMLSFDTGMIGFPLRLLAREVYDKVIKKISIDKVALITGEEKIIPQNAKYFLCTVESMPIDKHLEFVGVDEIQMCADHERGHIFTDRLLNMRGEKLTMLMGSNTIKNIISKLDADVKFINRNRLSKLTYTGHKKISRINRKTAIIAFSAEEVYAIAELIRRQKGGAAIVMGSLSPKTRNAQVELYQSGDVDFLVATDAIGMGINMDLDHVFFSNLKKFDGKKLRKLNLSEIGQIAGRAGRYLNDGNFGITGDCKEITSEDVELLENHKFEEIRNLFWRNSNLNFNNPLSLIKSLEEKPHTDWLRKIHECEDEKALKYFLREKSLINLEFNKKSLSLLWECCQIPDFVKKTYGNHYEVIGNVFSFLNSEKGQISDEFMRLQLIKLDKLEGNVDSLSNRIANVRTWSYVSNKNNWIENQDYWIEKTKHLEDRLSDRLHEELTKTFIDKRASVLARGLKQDMEFKTEIFENNDVIIDDQFIGKIIGLKLELDFKKGALETDIKSLKKAARQSIGPELEKRIQIIIDTGLIELNDDFKIYWNNFPIAKLSVGNDYLNPNFELIIDDTIEQNPKQKLVDFIHKWIQTKINSVLKSLIDLKNLKEKNSSIKALAYQLYENNGVLKREQVSEYLKSLGQNERKILRDLGVKFGRYHVFLYQLIKPEAVSLRTLLWKNFHQKYYKLKPPTFGLNFLDDQESRNRNFMLLCGFEKFDNLFVRIDILERLFMQIINSNSKENKEIKMVPEMLNLLGCSKDNFKKLLKKMGYKIFDKEEETFFKYSPLKQFKKNPVKEVSSENPFKVLKNLNLG